MPYSKSPMKKSSCIKMYDSKGKQSGLMMEGSLAHMESMANYGSPYKKVGPGDPDSSEETLVSSTTTRSRETTPTGLTGTRLTTTSKYETPGGEVKRTPKGDAAYAALSQEQKAAQDAKFKAKQRSESKTRFTPDPIKIPTAGVRSVKQEITTPDVNKEIYSKVFSPSENPNYGLRKKLYETSRSKRYSDVRSGNITLEEAKAQSKPLKEMKKAMFSPEEIKQKQQKRKVRKIKEAITSVIPELPKPTNLAKKRKTRGSGNPCKRCN